VSRTKQDSRKDGVQRNASSGAPSTVVFPAIIDELKTNDYKDDLVPSFQRVSISGEEMSGVRQSCVIVVIVMRGRSSHSPRLISVRPLFIRYLVLSVLTTFGSGGVPYDHVLFDFSHSMCMVGHNSLVLNKLTRDCCAHSTDSSFTVNSLNIKYVMLCFMQCSACTLYERAARGQQRR